MRKEKKLSQHQLAVKCQLLGWDVDRKLISKIEIGIREVTDADLRILAAAVNFPVGSFFEMSKPELKQALMVAKKA